MDRKNMIRILADQWKILKRSVIHFGTDRPIALAGTTAYFAVFSIAPILIIIISVFGYFTGNITIRDKLFEELNPLIGQESSSLLQRAIENYRIAENSGIGTVIGLVFFLISATTLFSIMQNSINYIWRVRVKGSLRISLFRVVRDRILSFGIILSMGFILLVSLFIDASVSFLKDMISTYFSPHLIIFVRIANLLLSVGIISLLFALIYHFLPDVKVKWSASWYGAFFTAVLFMLGRIVIGIVIGASKLGMVYGAASSLVVILAWVYYASVIFYFGVELTRQFSLFHQHNNIPVKYAVPFEITLLRDSTETPFSPQDNLPSPDQ